MQLAAKIAIKVVAITLPWQSNYIKKLGALFPCYQVFNIMYDVDKWFLEQDETHDTLHLWQKLVNLMAELCNTPAGFIVQMTERGYQVVIANESEENPYPAGGVIPTETNIFCRKVVEENRPLYVRNATELQQWQSNPEVSEDKFNSYLGFPLHWPSGKVFGTICVMDFKITNYSDKYHRLLQHFKEMVERELKLLEQSLHIREISILDEQTGLLNRRGFKSLLPKRIDIARRHKEHVAVCYYDLDNLKKINDQLGHDAGDKVIENFAHALTSSLRKTDVITRFGGDEFLAFVFMEDKKEITQVEQRLNDNLKAHKLTEDTQYSVGIFIVDNQNLINIDISKVINQADKRMYSIKHAKKGYKPT